MPGADDLAVFVGPSLPAAAVRARLPQARVEPPVARGDIDRLRADGATRFLILDGMFGHRLAVSPSEIVRALRDGVQIVGAASMGAIRASECWPAGMQGSGAVYALYRMGVIQSDDEVAVATDPEAGFAATSVALINIRYAVLAALRRRLLTNAAARAVLTAAKQTHFSERTFQGIFGAARITLTPALAELCSTIDIKARDGARAVGHVAGCKPAPIACKEVRCPRGDPSGRYLGHDPYLGYSIATLQDELMRWLVGTGRYRRYVAAERLSAGSEGTAAALWSTLVDNGELDGELMRWYAVRRACALDPTADGLRLGDSEQQLATEHGFDGWPELAAAVRSGALAGISWELLDRARRALAMARRNVSPEANRAGALQVGTRGIS
jgi:hypothetical protein